jgi:NodT family efflux transporter outer membrane factor (OMF) lipoprotein
MKAMIRHSTRAPAIAALLATLLAGCSTPHDQPKVRPLSAAAVGLGGKDEALLQDDWWTALGDAQLDRLMRDALAGNPSLDAAMARVRAAQAGIAAEKAALQPQVSGDVTEERERLSGKYIVPPPYAGTGRWVGSAQADLDWNLDIAGRQKALVDQARATEQATALDLAAARIVIAGSVSQTYVNLARADAQARIAEEFVASRRQSLELARSRVRNRLSSEFDLRASETLLAEAQQAQIRANGDRLLMIHALAALAGRGVDYYSTIQPPALTLEEAIPVPSRIPADLLGRRPDILAAKARIDAANAGRRVAKADFYPNVDIRAFVGASAIGLGALFTSGALTGGGGPAIHLPIFEGGQLKAHYRGALAGIDTAVADYNELVIRSVREAADALSSIETNTADAAAQHRILDGLSETVRLDTSRVHSGLGTQLDVLDANDRLLSAAQAQANIDADGVNHRIQLAVALGGGFPSATSAQSAIAN